MPSHLLTMKVSKYRLIAVLLLAALLSDGTRLRAAGKDSDRAAEVRSEIASANDWIKDQDQLQTKWAAMGRTPFTFYRATDHLFYHDLGSGLIAVPQNWKKADQKVSTWISGDFHLQNVGFVDTGNGNLVFEPNDFDESLQAPFHWDLIRCVASLFIIADSADWKIDALPGESEKDTKKAAADERLAFKLSQKDAEDLAMDFLKNYFAAVQGKHEPLDEAKVREMSGKDGWMTQTLDKQKGADVAKFWKKQTGGSQSAFDFPSLTTRLREVPKPVAKDFDPAWDLYQAAGVPPGCLEKKAEAERLGSGLGSLGVVKIYVLIEGPTKADTDNLLLECKETRAPSMLGRALPAPAAPAYKNEAERVSTAMHKMLTKVGEPEGGFTAGGRPYHVTPITPWGDGVALGDFPKRGDLAEFLKFTALALADAHCRAEPGFAASVQDFLAKQHEVKNTLVKLGEDYGQQVVKDFDAFTKSPHP